MHGSVRHDPQHAGAITPAPSGQCCRLLPCRHSAGGIPSCVTFAASNRRDPLTNTAWHWCSCRPLQLHLKKPRGPSDWYMARRVSPTPLPLMRPVWCVATEDVRACSGARQRHTHVSSAKGVHMTLPDHLEQDLAPLQRCNAGLGQTACHPASQQLLHHMCSNALPT